MPQQAIRVVGLATLTALAATGCLDQADGSGAGAPATLTLSVGALDLAGVTNADYTITVLNNASDTVFSVEVDARTFGTPQGSLSYVGPCDAQSNPNRVELTLNGLFEGPAGDVPIDPATYRAPGTLTQDVTCAANADVKVVFDLTLARRANQGFFDVAISFDDVFCSAKLDCADDAGQPLALLHDDGVRSRTIVLGLACTGGVSGADTTLYRDDIVVDCAGGTATVDPTAGPGNLVEGAGISGDAGVLFGALVASGQEQLGYDKIFWNVLLGLEDGAAWCNITTAATASDGLWGDLTTPAVTSYPYIAVDVAVTNATGGLACTQHPLDGVGVNAGVATTYTPVSAPRTFDYALGLDGVPVAGARFVVGALSVADPGRWSDGSVAASCDGYRHPADASDPATASGVYTVDWGTGAGEVFCDMVTDDGGWTRVIHGVNGATGVTSPAEVDRAKLLDDSTTTYAKLGDADIIALATAAPARGEYLLTKSDASSVYVMRMDKATEWATWAVNGPNRLVDSKDGLGAWSDDVCDGHVNNNGLSSYSDLHAGSCPVVYAGVTTYMATSYASGSLVNPPLYVYIR